MVTSKEVNEWFSEHKQEGGDCITTARKVLADFWSNGDYWSEDYHAGFQAGVEAVIAAIKKELKK